VSFIQFKSFRKFINHHDKNYFIRIKEQNFHSETTEELSLMDGIILLFSVTDKTSFNDLAMNAKPIRRKKDQKWMPILLLGNKIDDEENREVSEGSGRKLAKEIGSKYMECSALNNTNTQGFFFQVFNFKKFYFS
jgi:GTPase SAR1 family protein